MPQRADLLPEYTFDYSQAKPNPFVTTERTVVILDAELSKHFPTAKAVHEALRQLLKDKKVL